MSATNPEEESTNPEPNLTPAEVDRLNQLEAITQDGLEDFVQVRGALAEIRDRQLYRESHASFETYVSERWGVNVPSREPRAALRHRPCAALAEACEQTLSALDGDERLGIEIRLAVRKQGDPDVPADLDHLELSDLAGPIRDELVPTLRWHLTRATGTIGEVAHELESRAADIDDRAREQLRDDVLVLEGELAVVKALLFELIDWDSELKRLFTGELPPFDTDENDE
jgi:hypothetical protein